MNIDIDKDEFKNAAELNNLMSEYMMAKAVGRQAASNSGDMAAHQRLDLTDEEGLIDLEQVEEKMLEIAEEAGRRDEIEQAIEELEGEAPGTQMGEGGMGLL